VFVATVVVLSVVSVVLFLAPGTLPRIVAPALDLTLDTIALVVTGCVATLAWLRYHESRDDHAAYLAAAFLALALADAAAVVATLLQRPDSTLSTAEPDAEQLVVFLAGHLVCGSFMLAGAIRGLRGTFQGQRAYPLAAVWIAMLVVIALVWLRGPVPLLVVVPPGGGAPHLTALGVALNLVAGALFAASAVLYRRLGTREASVGDRYIAIGLLIGSFALLHSAVYPETHPGPVSTVNLLWLAVNMALLMAIEAEARSMLVASRAANVRLTGLRAVEMERAALEERARLHRELHDGLAQELWLAKLKVARLAASPALDDETRTMVDEVAEVVEASLAEARQAVIATRTISSSNGSFTDTLRLYVEDHADRFGLRVDFRSDAAIPELPARIQAELLRIAQEALANVRRHARATAVTVRTELKDRSLVLRIADDGCGFDVGAVEETAFGLESMRERAATIGGRFEITSTPGVGTCVEVVVPLGAADSHARPPKAAWGIE
jgi:signal transduction histidine kinase